MKKILFLLSFLLLGTQSYAQTGAVVSYNQEIFAAGVNVVTGSPIQTNTFLATVPLCNQVAAVVPAVVVNPNRIQYDDVLNVGKVCFITMVQANLSSVPSGTGYLSTLTYTNDLGVTSPRSAASNPFNLLAAPVALTGYKVLR